MGGALQHRCWVVHFSRRASNEGAGCSDYLHDVNLLGEKGFIVASQAYCRCVGPFFYSMIINIYVAYVLYFLFLPFFIFCPRMIWKFPHSGVLGYLLCTLSFEASSTSRALRIYCQAGLNVESMDGAAATVLEAWQTLLTSLSLQLERITRIIGHRSGFRTDRENTAGYPSLMRDRMVLHVKNTCLWQHVQGNKRESCIHAYYM